MRTPAIRVLLAILIAKGRFKGTTMQIQRHDIGSGEGSLRELRQEQLVDQADAFNADTRLLLRGRMGRHHDTAALPARAHSHIRAIIEGAHQATFRARELLIGGQVQARLDERLVKHLIVFATHHIAEACQIGKDGSGAILPIHTEEGTL
jgi:hypothetical protein